MKKQRLWDADILNDGIGRQVMDSYKYILECHVHLEADTVS